jgi:hypothetical protein
MKINSLPGFAFVLAFFSEAEGAVIYQEPFSFVGGPDPVEFDLDQNGTTDLSFRIRRSPTFVFGVSGPMTTSILRDQLGGFTQVSLLSPGFLIDNADGSDTYFYVNFTRPDGGFQLSSRFADGGTITGGPFFGRTGYLGFRFQGEEGEHYGYALVQDNEVIFGRILAIAWESEPNTPILAGAVPEPSTSTTLLTALAIILFRRRR